MTKFVYVSNDYREAWKTYVHNFEGMWEEFDKDFEIDFLYKLQEEEHSLKENTRPSSWYLNDKLGENEFLFNMSTYHYPHVPYEYTDNLPSFEDIMMERAIEMRDMGKEIDVLYSGGLDSVAIVYALREVCPPDQLHIIMGDETPIHIYPDGYKKMVGFLHYEFAMGDLYGISRPDTNLYTTGCEADRLFGSTGYPYGRHHNKELYTKDDTEWEYNQNRWWGITRHTLLTQSFRLLQNISVDKMDMNNYQPFFLSPNIEKYAINMHMDKKMVWHTNFFSDKEQFLKSKMCIRDFIAKWDKDYAYSMGKTNMEVGVQYENTLPIHPNFNVLAITEDGTIVNRKNIMDYMNKECLTI